MEQVHANTTLCDWKGVMSMAVKAQGAPTKEFFVGMLTRDIELNDAILDLLDNCLDGVVRQKKDTPKALNPDYYLGFFSHITISKDSFIIEDNCGGIPKNVAEKYAFRMGRASEKETEVLPTVGIYGIGMKRAIFKIGKEATVFTRNGDSLYKVTIPRTWANDENDWDFPMEDLETSELPKNGGTRISISSINPEITEKWEGEDKLDVFVDSLIIYIRQSYSFIIQKGFEIKINGKLITPLQTNLLLTYDAPDRDAAIKPFMYQQTFGDVHVSLALGFYASPPSPDDIDDENDLKRSSSDAGWTIVCNDRVVLYNDKTHLTGWGEAGVPQYHTQFIGIRGVVAFESTNPKALPMTTTKRGVDTSSSIYAAVKNRMREGLKMFTEYTNRWKGRNNMERTYSTRAKEVPIGDLIVSTDKIENSTKVKFHTSKGGFVFKPVLPKPKNDRPYRRISFSRNIDEVKDIVEYIYDDREHCITPSQVGELCFERVLKEAHKKVGE